MGPEANAAIVHVAATSRPRTVNDTVPRGARRVAANSAVPMTSAAAVTTCRRRRPVGPSTVARSVDGTRRLGKRQELGGRPTIHSGGQSFGGRLSEHHGRVTQQLIESAV